MAIKKMDGRYHLEGYVNESPIHKNVRIEFMIDSSQVHTTISIADAKNNLIRLHSLEIETERFEVGDKKIDAYVYPNCTVYVPSQNRKRRLIYELKLKKVYIPFKNISANRLEPDLSRLGLDFLENYGMKFHTIELDRDQVMILEEPDRKLP